jgi:DNA-directed RNA polymerase subunit RPC12/RpoP
MNLNIENRICLHCNHYFTTIKYQMEIIRCPKCGSTITGKQEYNHIHIKHDNCTNRWRYNSMENSNFH